MSSLHCMHNYAHHLMCTYFLCQVWCTIVAALIQYFFLASFCWMLCEGIMLYLLIVKVFGKAAQRWYWLLILGWGT